jgi:hypothetical protein
MNPILSGSNQMYVCGAPFSPAPKDDVIADVARSGIAANSLDSASKYRDLEWAYLEILADSNLLALDTAIQHLFDSLDVSSLGAAVRAKVELEAPDSLVAAAELAMVYPTDLNIASQKELLQTRLDDPVFDQQEIAQLIVLANTCEVIGGVAVNEARMLLSIEGYYFWEDPGCDTVAAPVKKSGTIFGPVVSPKAICWPNPADQQLYVSVPDVSDNVKIEVRSALGQLLWNSNGALDDQPATIDVSKWSQGLVLVRVTLASGEVYSWRVVIER